MMMQLLGVIAAFCTSFAYLLILSGRVNALGTVYLGLNLVGAILFLVMHLYLFIVGNIMLDLFWLGITFYGIWQRVRLGNH